MPAVVHRDALEALLRAPNGPVGRYLLERALRVAGLAKTLCPVGTRQADWRGRVDSSPHLSQSIDADRRPVNLGTGLGVYVRAKKPYAMAVHEGARPHVILPVNRTVLRFQVGGKVVFARRVNHPGNAGNPFLRKALSAVR